MKKCFSLRSLVPVTPAKVWLYPTLACLIFQGFIIYGHIRLNQYVTAKSSARLADNIFSFAQLAAILLTWWIIMYRYRKIMGNPVRKRTYTCWLILTIIFGSGLAIVILGILLK